MDELFTSSEEEDKQTIKQEWGHKKADYYEQDEEMVLFKTVAYRHRRRRR